MRQSSETKQKIMDAALYLFNTKGFHGTSIRDIAGKAKVNQANIAYYFQNKQGLLEECLTLFYEQYLLVLEQSCSLLDVEGGRFCLKEFVKKCMVLQSSQIQLTRLVLREISIDSQMVREVMSTYLMKERFYIKRILEKGIESREFRPHSFNFTIIQLKGMLAMPYLNAQYMTEVLHLFPQEKFFVDKYIQEIYHWIDEHLCFVPIKQQELMYNTI